MFNPTGFFDIASRLCNTGANEAELRTSISRSYCASFLKAREMLVSRGYYKASNTGTDHPGTIRALARLGLGALRDDLDELRHMRGTADYNLREQVDLNMAHAAKSRAESLLKGIPQIK